jgi:hypothetical protein
VHKKKPPQSGLVIFNYNGYYEVVAKFSRSKQIFVSSRSEF